MARQADAFANGPRRFPERPGEPSFPSGILPGRWTQLRNADGSVSARTADLSSTTLPLSDAGLRAVQAGTVWSETAQVEDQPVLIYSLPISTQGKVTSIVSLNVSTTADNTIGTALGKGKRRGGNKPP